MDVILSTLIQRSIQRWNNVEFAMTPKAILVIAYNAAKIMITIFYGRKDNFISTLKQRWWMLTINVVSTLIQCWLFIFYLLFIIYYLLYIFIILYLFIIIFIYFIYIYIYYIYYVLLFNTYLSINCLFIIYYYLFDMFAGLFYKVGNLKRWYCKNIYDWRK